MIIKIRIVAHVSDEFKNFELELPDGSTVKDMADECLRIKNFPFTSESIRGATIMSNGDLIEFSNVLNEGDTVTILSPLVGG